MKDIQPIIQEFTEQAKAHYGDRLAKIILFGSYARGEAHEDSDVDIMLLLNDEEVSSNNEKTQIFDITWSLFMKYSIIVSALPLSFNKFISMNKALYRFVKKEGIYLYE
ncbi:MAG: nucleotidyltransferase domain-containing protein [Arcicella sp.]|nr:nucleotidyltransferase domain-containing protein [Arcicella sp.]